MYILPVDSVVYYVFSLIEKYIKYGLIQQKTKQKWLKIDRIIMLKVKYLIVVCGYLIFIN